MRLSQVRIGTRLAGGFGLMIVVIATMVAVGWLKVSAVKGDLELIAGDRMVRERLSQQMSEQAHITARVMRTMVMLDDLDRVRGEQPKITAARGEYERARTALVAMPAQPDTAALLQRIDVAAAAARAVDDRVIALALADRDDEATDLVFGPSIAANRDWQDALDENIALQQRLAGAAYDDAVAAYAQAVSVLIGAAVAGIVVALLAGWAITRSVVRPIQYLRECALRMAAGDLSQPVERRVGFDGEDETSQLVAAMQQMHDSLRRLVSEVHGSAASVSSAAQQIAQGNADLSSRTEQQASNLEQTAASMEQLTATVRQNADSAQHANQLTRDATEVVARGGSAMGEVIGTMRGIHAGSQKIAEIIGVIDGIAFQTNILALNAAVEAARAGEQGRGFAVVASEVRALAQRSAAAAREIKALISDSVHQVSTGTQLVEKAGGTIDEVVKSIAQVTSLVAEITAASREQASGIAQVGDAVTQMDQMTQQNAALVEQSAAAAESLNAQARDLVSAVSKFRLAEA